MSAGANANTIRSTQLGIQNTFGTGVEAHVILSGLGADFKPVVPAVMLSKQKTKAPSDQVLTKGAMTTGKWTGWAGYNDLVYVFSTLLKAATISTPGGATNTRDWTWILLPQTAETPLFTTFETGIVGVDLARVADVSLTGLKLAFEQNREVAVDGDLIGTQLALEGATPTTSSLTSIVSVPISVNLMDCFMADSIGGLSAGLLGSMYKSNWSISNRRAPVFPIRSDKPSFGGLAETPNGLMTHIEIENDTQSYNMVRQMRAANTRYVQTLITGPEIEPTFNYALEITHAFTVMNPDLGPMDPVYGGMYDLQAIQDATLGGFCKIRLRCSLTALVAATNLTGGEQPAALIAALSAPGFS